MLKQRRSLVEIVDPQRFKPYDDLKAKFYLISGTEVEGLSAA